MYLQISNRGLIEPGALSLMGASVKDADAIGKFGSGFKYALATVLRHGLELRIFSGLIEFAIETRPETFRDRAFDVIWINGERTSITTRTGVEWKLRDAIREIYSNAYDEGGCRWWVSPDISTSADESLIVIEMNDELEDMVAGWQMYFTHDVPALWEQSGNRILRQPVPNYYRRNIWICEDRHLIPHFSYSFAEIDLPESRKISSYSVQYYLYELLSRVDDDSIFAELFDNLSMDKAEWTVMESWLLSGAGRQAFDRAFRARWDYIGLEKQRAKLPLSGQRVLWIDERFALLFCRMGFTNVATAVDYSDDYTVLPWPIGYKDRLTKPLAALAAVGVDYASFPIKYAEYHKDNSPIAFTHKATCFLTQKAFEISPRMLMKALVEEWTHLEHHVDDGSVAQQHVYLDLIINLIERK